MTKPTTNHNIQPSYTGTATITLTPTDDAGGSGVKATYYRLDGGVQTTGTVITVSATLKATPSDTRNVNVA